mgnify:CR=1 FL=1
MYDKALRQTVHLVYVRKAHKLSNMLLLSLIFLIFQSIAALSINSEDDTIHALARTVKELKEAVARMEETEADMRAKVQRLQADNDRLQQQVKGRSKCQCSLPCMLSWLHHYTTNITWL